MDLLNLFRRGTNDRYVVAGGQVKPKGAASTIAERIMRPFSRTTKLREPLAYTPEGKAHVAAYEPLKMIQAGTIADRARIPRKMKGALTGSAIETEVSGLISWPVQNPRTEKVTVHSKWVSGWKELQELHGHKSYRAGRAAMESSEFFDGTQGAGTIGPAMVNDEFHPIPLGAYNRQQYQCDMWDMQSKGFQIKNHNPLGRGHVNIVRNYVLGNGLKYRAENPLVQFVLDEFEEDATGYGEPLHALECLACDDLTSLGEYFWRREIDADGRLCIELIDASMIWEIITNPVRIAEVYFYHLQGPTQYQWLLGNQQTAKVPVMEYRIEQIPANMMSHVRINHSIGEKRGRSDYLDGLGILKRHLDILDAVAVKAQNEAAFVWRKKIKGGIALLREIMNDPAFTSPPSPGSVVVENEEMDTEPLTGSSGSGSGSHHVEVLKLLQTLWAISKNLPPEWFGSMEAGARSTGLLKADPSTKMIVGRQQVFRDQRLIMRSAIVGAAIASGRIPKFQPRKEDMKPILDKLKNKDFRGARNEVLKLKNKGRATEPLDDSVEVIAPDVVEEERPAYLKDINTGVDMGYISHETGANMYADKMGVKNYDYENEQDKITTEKELMRGPLAGPSPDMLDEPQAGKPGGPGAKPSDGKDPAKAKGDPREVTAARKREVAP